MIRSTATLPGLHFIFLKSTVRALCNLEKNWPREILGTRLTFSPPGVRTAVSSVSRGFLSGHARWTKRKKTTRSLRARAQLKKGTEAGVKFCLLNIRMRGENVTKIKAGKLQCSVFARRL